MPIRPISNALQKKAEEVLHEVPSRIPEDIAHIKQWLAQQPHLHKVNADDQLILNFLRGCKFSLQRTKEKMDMLYTMKSLLPEFYLNRDPLLPEIQEMLQFGLCLPLPKTVEDDGPRIILIRCEPADPEKVSFLLILKVCLMIIDILLYEDDNFIISGQHGFLDFKGMSLNHMAHLNLNATKKTAICLEHAYPTRPQGFHFINTPVFIETVFSMVTPFISEKLRKRIHVYSGSSMKDLYREIPCSLLPKDYGGNGESLVELGAYWKKKVESHRDWFLENEKYCSDEAKRNGIPKTSVDMFGMEGSFRKLAVD